MTHQKTIKTNIKRPHFENLDALRFIAAFSVFIFHFFKEIKVFVPMSVNNSLYKSITFITNKGLLGVNFFFVLSGFLITFLIIYEIKNTQKFNLKHFLIRRTLRIWPLYFIVIVIGFIIFPFLFKNYYTLHHPLNYVFFLANFDEIWYGAKDTINFLTSPWSVAVEEQFYLIWGITLFTLNKLKILQFSALITLLLIVSLFFRWLNSNDYNVIYYHTLSVMPDILIGSFLAYLYQNKFNWLNQFKNMKKLNIIIVYIIGFSVILLKNKIFVGQLIILERYIFALFFAFILYDQILLKNSFIKVGKIKLFNHLGKISYGLYMYHLIVIFLLQKIAIWTVYYLNGQYYLVTSLFLIGSLIITYLTSKFSYKYIEQPFLKLKKHFK